MMHQAMRRRGWQLGREQTRRLMRKAGLRGVQRGKPARCEKKIDFTVRLEHVPKVQLCSLIKHR